jgi:hypothetical protein
MNDSRRKPNVLIFFTDDQGTLDANCYGSTDLFTPNMDRLAAEGRCFGDRPFYALTVEEPQLRRNWATVAHSRRELG